MSVLPEIIHRGRFTYTQIKREGNIAIYEQRQKGSVKSCFVRFEVIIISEAKRKRVLRGRLLSQQGDEEYPAPANWGRRGWTLTTLSAAHQKFDELVQAQSI